MLRFRFFTLAWNVPHLHICIVISEPSWIEFRLVLCFLLSHRISFTFNSNSWLILMTAKSHWNSRMHVLHVQSRQPRELSIAIRQSVSFSSRALNLPLLMMINESSRRSFFFCVFIFSARLQFQSRLFLVSRRSTMGGSEIYRWNLVRFSVFTQKNFWMVWIFAFFC